MFSVSLIFVLLLFAGASCRPDKKACVITEEELKDILHSIVEVYGKNLKLPKSVNCDKLIGHAESCTNELKNFVSGKISESDENFNTAVATYNKKEDQQIANIKNIPSSKVEEYQKVIKEIGSRIKEFHEKINRLNLEKEKHLMDIAYYQDVLNNGTKSSSRFDLDSFFKSAKTCSFKRDAVISVIRKFNEIFEMTLGIPRSSQGECFEEIRLQLQNVDSVISSRIGDDRVNSLKNTYDERMRVYNRLSDDYLLEIEEEGQKNIAQISDELQKLNNELKELEAETKSLQRESLKNAIKTVKAMIRSGNKMRKAKQLYAKIQVDLKNPYEMVLKRTYDCDVEYIPNVVVFAEMNSRHSGFEIIANEMQTCNHTESPFMLVVAKALRDKLMLLWRKFMRFGLEVSRQKTTQKLNIPWQCCPTRSTLKSFSALL